MDPAVVGLLAELDPSAYVIDCLPTWMRRRSKNARRPLVQTLRKSQTQTPILLVEDRTYANAPSMKARRNAMNQAGSVQEEIRQADRRQSAGPLYLIGDNLIPGPTAKARSMARIHRPRLPRQAEVMAEAIALLPAKVMLQPIDAYTDKRLRTGR
jgi:hypothetical protein